MRLEDYPPQEALSELGQRYADSCWQRSAGVNAEINAGASVEEHAYVEPGEACQRLLVYPSARPDGRVLLLWHGGGWTSGYKEWMGFMAPPLNAAGVTVVSAGYRLAPQHLFPAGLEDCAAALDWVVAHIASVGGDAQQLFIGGHSAGGHYAALLALGAARLRIRGCLPISGVYDFRAGSGLSNRPRFLGPAPSQADTAADAASPMVALAALRPTANAEAAAPTVMQLPAFFISHGSADFPHLMTQAGQFAQALRQAGASVEHLVMAERTHFTAHFASAEPDGPWLAPALAFMARHANR